MKKSIKKYKNLLIVCLFIIVLIIVIIRTVYQSKNNNFEIERIEGVTIEIKENTLTNTGATIIITDISGKNYTYGYGFEIQKLVNGKWKRLKLKNKNIAIPAIGFSPNENNQIEIKQSWIEEYGSLRKGKYRIIKNMHEGMGGRIITHYIATEFYIE